MSEESLFQRIGERMRRHPRAVMVVGCIAFIVIMILLLPNKQMAFSEAQSGVGSIISLVVGLFVTAVVFLGPWCAGVVSFIGIELMTDENGNGFRLVMMLLSGLAVGVVWMLILPLSMTNPVLYGMFSQWGWRTTWEVVPWSWFTYGILSSCVGFGVTWIIAWAHEY